jgi:hypothetical protein
MTFRKTLLGLAALAVGVLGLTAALDRAAHGQGAGGAALPSAQGTDVITVQRGTSPLINTLTVNQIATLINQGDSTPRNLLLGGDFGTNPFQRGTSQAADIANTATYGPDGWFFIGGASSAINWSQQTGASDITAGFSASLRFQRKATNADTAAICVGQVLDSTTAVRFQGQTGIYSFWALSGANFSAASGNLNVTAATGTGASQSAASFAAATWTGYSSRTLTPAQGTVTAAAGIAQAVTATWTRYSFSFPVAATATQVGVKICYTPVGTAGANDWVEFIGEQLEVSGASGTVSPFDYHLPATELNVSQRRLIVYNEPASGIGIGMGVSDTTTACLVTIAFPDTMASAPTVTFAGNALSATTWLVRANAGNRVLSTPFLAANGGHSVTNMNLTATTGATQVVGQACVLQGAGGGGKIIVSSEL